MHVDPPALTLFVAPFSSHREELLAYPIGWNTLAQHNILNEVMNTWVSKKITEHLGEEEPSLVEFIMGECL